MCTFKESTKKLLGLALISGVTADAAAYTNVFTKTSHVEGNKVVAKIGLGVMAASLVAAYINEKCNINVEQNEEEILSDDDVNELVESVSDAMESITKEFSAGVKSAADASIEASEMALETDIDE